MRWASSWFCQKSGAEAFASSSAMRPWSLAGSKIAPHKRDARAEFGVTVFEVFEDHGRLLGTHLSIRIASCFRRLPGPAPEAELREAQQSKGRKNAQPWQPIAPARIKRQVAAVCVWRFQCRARVRRQLGDHAAIGI